jgi:hypothetical protein
MYLNSRMTPSNNGFATPAQSTATKPEATKTNQPVAGINISLRPMVGSQQFGDTPGNATQRQWASMARLFKTVETDAQGNFEMRNISPGEYNLSALTTLPGFRTAFDQHIIQVESGKTSDVAVALKPYPGITWRFVLEGGRRYLKARRLLCSITSMQGPASRGLALQRRRTAHSACPI